MIGHVTGHVGSRVSALIDGQLPAAESDRLWAHVHGCASCRYQVEREGWVKTRLAGLALAAPTYPAPTDLRGSLVAVGWSDAGFAPEPHQRRVVLTAVLGAGSVGAAMVGVLALAVPAEAPGGDRRLPTTSLTRQTASPTPRTTSAPITMSRIASLNEKWVTITP